jgi:adenosylcobinamide-GDP ribazoletransferase
VTKKVYRLFRLTLGFLTIVPAPTGPPLTQADLSRMAGYFPMIGLFCGLISALFWLILGTLGFSESLKAIFTVVVLVILTRGFHLDGLADAADALLSHRSVEEKLAILKDCHLGTFGVAAIVLDLLLKISLLVEIASKPETLAVLALFPLWGRLAASVVATLGRYARPSGGLGQFLVEGAGPSELKLAVITSLIASLLLGIKGILTIFVALLVGYGLSWLWRRTLGGVTGDLLGATVEIGEIAGLFFWSLG